MRLNDLLRDATGAAPSASQRSQHFELAKMLNARLGPETISVKAVEKWFERQSIPGPWLIRIAAVARKKIDLSNYA